jgi:hypothetical protein
MQTAIPTTKDKIGIKTIMELYRVKYLEKRKRKNLQVIKNLTCLNHEYGEST